MTMKIKKILFHVARIPEEQSLKEVLQYKPTGRRNVNRFSTRWMNKAGTGYDPPLYRVPVKHKVSHVQRFYL
jgi:hypothetical protein